MSDYSSTAAGTWKRLSSETVRLFHAYANWLVGISWKRFIALSVLLLILANVLASLPPFSRTITEVNEGPSGVRTPSVPPVPPAARAPGVTIEKGTSGTSKDDTEVNITIDKNGVRISPRSRTAPAAASAASAAETAAQAASTAASAAGVFSAGQTADGGVQINLPPGATSEAVKEAVEEARKAVIEAIEESRKAAVEAAEEARQAAQEAADEARSESSARRVRTIRSAPASRCRAWPFSSSSPRRS